MLTWVPERDNRGGRRKRKISIIGNRNECPDSETPENLNINKPDLYLGTL